MPQFFPYTSMFRWLSYGNDPAAKERNKAIDDTFFLRREFSFTIENDTYIRYLSYLDAEELRADMRRRQPHKIDIGAVFTAPAKDHLAVAAGAFQPCEREVCPTLTAPRRAARERAAAAPLRRFSSCTPASAS